MSTKSNHLGWLFLQGLLFLPAVLPEPEWRDYGWAIVFPLFLLGWLSYCLVRNVVRVVREPAVEATRWNVVRLAVCGALFLLLASGPLLEGRGADTKVLGACWLTLGVLLVLLGARAVLRLRSARVRQGRRTDAPRPSPGMPSTPQPRA